MGSARDNPAKRENCEYGRRSFSMRRMIQAMKNTEKEKKLLEIVGELSGRLSKNAKTHVVEMAQFGEWGIGLEDLCNIIFEDDITISQDIFDKIERLGRLMEMEESTWDFIKPLVKK